VAKSPKLGRRSRSSNWISVGHVLSDGARQRLANIVGLEPKTDAARLLEMYRKTQYFLGAYPGTVETLDRAPRVSDYIAAYRKLTRQIDQLLVAMDAMNGRVKEDLDADLATIHKIELGAVERNIKSLRASALNRLKVFAKLPASGGRPRSIALTLLINSLVDIFYEYRKDTDANTFASTLSFVSTALGDAGIEIAPDKRKRLVRVSRQGK
jgi:hypothetical protein